MNELISIIIPAYNIQNYLRKSIESVLNQTYKNLEIIIVDDGSTDDTPIVLDKLAKVDARIRVIHKANAGVTSARLEGVFNAKGKYIGFVDGDDFVEPEMFELLLNNALKYNADISHCGYQMVFPDGHVDYYYNTHNIVEQDQIESLKDLLSGAFVEPGLWNKLFRKDLFHSLLGSDIMDMNIKINEDLLMNYYLFKEAKWVVYEDLCPYHYILRKNSAATAEMNEYKLKDPIRVLKIILEDTKEIPEVHKVVARRMVCQMIRVATLPLNGQSKLIRMYRKEIRTELRRKLPEIFKKNICERSLKLKAFWVAICPVSYQWIHMIYSKVTGLDRKYSVE